MVSTLEHYTWIEACHISFCNLEAGKAHSIVQLSRVCSKESCLTVRTHPEIHQSFRWSWEWCKANFSITAACCGSWFFLWEFQCTTEKFNNYHHTNVYLLSLSVLKFKAISSWSFCPLCKKKMMYSGQLILRCPSNIEVDLRSPSLWFMKQI